MNPIKIQYHNSKYGELILGSFNEQLCLCDWRFRTKRESIDQRITKNLNAEYIIEESRTLLETIKQLDEYMNYKRKTFDIPLLFIGTEFQKEVWNQLLTIPFGATPTYLKQATKIGKEKAVRAVANANGANAISIIVPCHRIVGSNGKLVGYAGGLKTKQKLLELEQDMFIQS